MDPELAEHLREVEGRLARVLDRVADLLPEGQIAFDRDLVLKHGEYGVALDFLCDQLSDNDVAVPADVLAEMEALAKKMGIPLRGSVRVQT